MEHGFTHPAFLMLSWLFDIFVIVYSRPIRDKLNVFQCISMYQIVCLSAILSFQKYPEHS